MPMNEYGEIIRNSSPPPPIPPNPNHNPNGNNIIRAILIIIGCIILGSIIGISIYRNINETGTSKAGRTNSDNITNNYSDEEIHTTDSSVITNEATQDDSDNTELISTINSSYNQIDQTVEKKNYISLLDLQANKTSEDRFRYYDSVKDNFGNIYEGGFGGSDGYSQTWQEFNLNGQEVPRL